MATDPRDLALAQQIQADLHAVEAGGKTQFTDALHASLNQGVTRLVQLGVLSPDDAQTLGFSPAAAKASGPHPMDGGDGGNKNPN